MRAMYHPPAAFEAGLPLRRRISVPVPGQLRAAFAVQSTQG